MKKKSRHRKYHAAVPVQKYALFSIYINPGELCMAWPFVNGILKKTRAPVRDGVFFMMRNLGMGSAAGSLMVY
jgi:hypothetical protein